jgi:hypothetical protein
MPTTFRGEVIHVVAPEDFSDYELQADLRSLADSQYLLICREGGSPSLIDRLRSFLTRRPIEAVTLISDHSTDEGSKVAAAVIPTEIGGVYEAVSLKQT